MVAVSLKKKTYYTAFLLSLLTLLHCALSPLIPPSYSSPPHSHLLPSAPFFALTTFVLFESTPFCPFSSSCILFHLLFIVTPPAAKNLFGDAAIGEYFRVFISYGVITVALIMYETKKRRNKSMAGQELAAAQKEEEAK